MKVLIIHNYYQSKFKGGEDIVFERELYALKQLLGETQVFSYSVHNDSLNKWAVPFSIWFSFKHYHKIFELCKNEKIDLVHVHNFFPMLTTSVFLAAKRAGCKVVHTLHNYRWWCLNGALFYKKSVCQACVTKRVAWFGVKRGCYRGSQLQSFLAGLAFSFYKRKSVQKAIDAYFVLSKHQESMVRDLLPHKTILLKPNAVTIATPIQAERKGYIFVGRLEEGKGIVKLLDAWRQLDTTFELTVVGSGELEVYLKETYNLPNIRFIGNQTSESLGHLMAQSRYCIHPSLYYETFGLVILEAMAQGTPVIGFNIGTRPEFIEDGKNGFLTTEADLPLTIHKAESLNQEAYTTLSQNARLTAYRFEQHAVTRKQVVCYQQILEAV